MMVRLYNYKKPELYMLGGFYLENGYKTFHQYASNIHNFGNYI